MITKPASALQPWVQQILQSAGADERNARAVAEHLVDSNLCGVDTHGVQHVPSYINAIRKGEILPTAWPEILTETPSTALVSGNWTFGHTSARFAIQVAIAKALDQGAAVVSVVRANHIGRLGYYAEQAAARGLVAMIWAGGFGAGTPAAAPFGGRERVLHTNPLSMAFPAGAEPAPMFDFATTTVAGMKVNNARLRGQTLPPGCIIDKDGRPSTNPQDFYDGGAFLPFGGHKGYAMMVAVEFLGGLFSGADAYAEATRGGGNFGHQGVTMIVFRADLFQPLPEFKQSVDGLAQRLRATPPAPGFDEVLVPGDPEARARRERARAGIPIPDDIWGSLTAAATALSVPLI
jgi:LDH2 family malate/lactate/ureidoglycolate dehydrogenase